jgi:hypothetical protein
LPSIYPHFTQADHFGGFPFIPYLQQNERVAFHGPITEDNGTTGDPKTWHLLRGPVSHGCNRMVGEHVVELAQILGVDMSATFPPSDGSKGAIRPKSLTKLDVAPAFAKWKGKNVDVDYAVDPQARVGNLPKLPPSDATTIKFPTWSADDGQYPLLVCAFTGGTPGANYCAQKLPGKKNAGGLFAAFAEVGTTTAQGNSPPPSTGCTSKSLASDPGVNNPTGAVGEGACVFSNGDGAVEQCHGGTWHAGVTSPDQDGDSKGLFSGTGPFGPCVQ